MKFKEMLSIWDPIPRIYIWVTWVQETYQAMTADPYHHFSRNGPHSVTNCRLLSLKSRNLKKLCKFVVQGLEATLVLLGLKRPIKP